MIFIWNTSIPGLSRRETCWPSTIAGKAQKNEMKTGQIMWPVRIAISGLQSTPGGATELCALLGKEESLARIRTGIELLSK